MDNERKHAMEQVIKSVKQAKELGIEKERIDQVVDTYFGEESKW